MCPYELTVWQLVSSWHWNLLNHHYALMERSISGGRLFKIFEWSLWFSYFQKNQHFSSCRNVCVSTACSSSFRRAPWELSCQPFPDYLPLCHGFPVVISSKWSAQCTRMSLCSPSETAQNRACRVPGVNNFKIWPQCSGLVLFRFKRRVENGKSTCGEQST